jgi:hypothetical protein
MLIYSVEEDQVSLLNIHCCAMISGTSGYKRLPAAWEMYQPFLTLISTFVGTPFPEELIHLPTLLEVLQLHKRKHGRRSKHDESRELCVLWTKGQLYT